MFSVKVRRFNETRPPPDVQREDWMMSFVRDSFPGGEVGYRYVNLLFSISIILFSPLVPPCVQSPHFNFDLSLHPCHIHSFALPFCREPNEQIHDLLAKQADLIRYLKEHNAMLNHKIMQLSSRSHMEPECT